MSEWRLFEEGTIPDFTTMEFFRTHPWIPPGHQIGHAERTAMTVEAVEWLIENHGVHTVAELGCGDGTLGSRVESRLDLYLGFDACEASVFRAREKGLTAILRDIRTLDTSSFQAVISCEVVEHLGDPHGFVRNLKSEYLVLTSPSAEDAVWHYEHHAWAWDEDGYRALVEGAGWEVLRHDVCDAPEVTFEGGTRRQQFQCVVAQRWSAS